jgi:hypothetical protein
MGSPRLRGRRRLRRVLVWGVGALAVLVFAGAVVVLASPGPTVGMPRSWPPSSYAPAGPPCEEGAICVIRPQDHDRQVVEGCVVYPQDVRIPPGEALTIDVTVEYGRCVPKELPAGASSSPVQPEPDLVDGVGEDGISSLVPGPPDLGDPVGSPVVVGGIARLALVSPTFPGSIGVVSSEEQRIDGVAESGSWSWEIKPDRPGGYVASLVLSILGPDGEELLKQNARIPVSVIVPDTPAYRIEQIWLGFLAITTSAAGVLAGVATALAAAFALVPALRRRKAGKVEPPAEASDRRGSDGYV